MDSKFVQRFIEIASLLGRQRHLVAIRDGFIAIIPFIIVGSFAVLINNFPPIGSFHFVEWMNQRFGDENWQTIGNTIWLGTFAIFGLLIVFSIAYQLAKSYQMDGLTAGFIATSSYIMLVPTTPNDWGLDFTWLGLKGVFIAIVLAIGLTELYRMLIQSKLTIKVPEGVPSGVEKSIQSFIPTMIILILVGLFQWTFALLMDTSIFEFVYYAIQQPFQGLSDTLPAAIIVSFLNQLFWFVGLHGTNILGGIVEPIYLSLILENINVFHATKSAFDVPNIVTKPFLDAFVFMGGAGTTLSLIFAILIVARKEKNNQYKEVAKLSLPAGIFNINEPIIFGLPIVLNLVMFIPFLFIPTILTIISYFSLATGLVPKTVALVPWSTPPILSGYLVTGGSFRGICLQIFNLFVATMIYIPFVHIGIRMAIQQTGGEKGGK